MAVVRNLMVRAGADFSGMRREMQGAQKTLSSFSNTTSRVIKGIALTLGGIGIKNLVKESVDAYNQVVSANMGLQSILDGQGKDFNSAKAFVQSYISDGLIPLSDAMTAYKQLSSRGYSQKETEDTLIRLKDSAAFNRQASLSMGEAVKSATEGLKNENSILVDNAGVTKNVSKMWEDYAKKMGVGVQSLTKQQRIQAEVNGIMEETKFQTGDAAKYAGTLGGMMAGLSAKFFLLKAAIGGAMAPIYRIAIPAIASLMQTLTNAFNIISQFTQALFGKNTAETSVKTTSKQADAVGELGDAYQDAGKQAKGALAGFDEINSLADSSGGAGTDAAAGAGASIDQGAGVGSEPDIPAISPQIQAAVDNVKTQIKSMKDTIVQNKEIIISALGGILAAFLAFKTITFFSTLPTLFAGIGTALSGLLAPIAIASAVIGALVAAFLYLYQTNQGFRDQINAVWSDIAQTLKDFYQSTLKPIGDYFTNDFIKPIAEAFKNSVLPILADMFIGASLIFKDLLNLVITIFNDIWQVIKPAMDLVKTIIVDVLGIIKGLWDKYGQDIINNVRNLIKGLQETFQLIWTNIINPIIQPALQMLSDLWTYHLSGLLVQVGEFVMKLLNGALEIYNGFIKPIIDWMVIQFGPVVSGVISTVIKVFGGFLGVVSDVVKGVFKTLGGLIDFIVGVFTGNWQKAWEGVKEIFGGIFDSFGAIVKGALNLVIDAINGMLRSAIAKLNEFIQSAVALANEVPGFSFNVGIIPTPQIPRLAKGGITNGEMTAVIGDNPGGREVVSPLDDLKDIIATAVSTAMVNAMQFTQNQSGGQSTANFYLDGAQFARAIIPSIDKEKRRTGNMAISLG